MESEKKTSRLKAKIFIVDDHPIVQEYLAQLINHQRDLTVCGVAGSIADAVQRIQADSPDMVISDISLGDSNGINLIKDLKEIRPNLPVLVVSMHDESLYAERALRAGARGYICKQEATHKIMSAIRLVLAGERYLSETMSAKILNRAITGDGDAIKSPVASLTNRELEVLELLGKGRGSREIAGTLNLSIKTIEVYRDRIKQKLNLKSASELVHYAVTWFSEQHSR